MRVDVALAYDVCVLLRFVDGKLCLSSSLSLSVMALYCCVSSDPLNDLPRR